ncbi:MAG TPA: DinB family protein [Bryobacteraceae bacterium]
MVKYAICAVLLASFTGASVLHGQDLSAVVTEVNQSYQSVKNNLLKSAEKVPEEDYSFKPTPEIRSFGEVMAHVVEAQGHTCGAILGQQGASHAKLDSKTEIVSALKNAFSECDKAYGSLTASNATEMIKTGRGQRTRLGALMGNTTHDVEQYAILSVYMRLKGIVPPSSEQSGK